MCYSAQLQASYMKYLRETGAEMDIDQFVEIFGARVTDSSIRIPRAVERWFDEPKTDGDARSRRSSMSFAPWRPRSSSARCSHRKAACRCRAHAGIEADEGCGREQAHRGEQD